MLLTSNFCVLPSHRVRVEDILAADNYSVEDAARTLAVTGVEYVNHAISGSLSTLVFEGLGRIMTETPELLTGIDAVLVVSQSYDQRIPSLSTRIQNFLNLKSSTWCLDVMDGCAGFVKAVSIVRMLEKSGYAKVLVVCGDINSVLTRNSATSTKILFGDGISVSIFEGGASIPRASILNKGDREGTISCGFEADDSMLMNGFEVFRFTRTSVPKLVEVFLGDSGEKLSDYDLIGMHQASRLVVDSLAEVLGLESSFGSSFLCNNIGNLGAGSIGAWLSQVSSDKLADQIRILAVGYGSGLSWGVASFEARLTRNKVIHVEC